MSDNSILQRSAAVLEWDLVLEVLAGHAKSSMGAQRCRALPLETDLEAARTRFQETAEMVALREEDDPFPSLSVPDLREAVGRASKGATLEPYELRDLSLVMGLAEEVTRYLRARRQQAAALCAVAAPLEAVREVSHIKDDIDRCIDPESN
ncbi:MAG: hypothetical protein ACREIS_00995, partial [Nitrospiraceae bacterium]